MLRRMLPPLLALVLFALHAPLPGMRPAVAVRSCCGTAACCRAEGPCAGHGACPLAKAAGPAETSRPGATGGPCFEAGRCGGGVAPRLAPPTIDPSLPALASGAPLPASGADACFTPSGRPAHHADEPPSPPPRA